MSRLGRRQTGRVPGGRVSGDWPAGSCRPASSARISSSCETVPAGDGPALARRVGGASIIYPRPSWQQGAGTGYGDHRLVPDTAWNAAVNGGVDVYITAYPAFNCGNTTGCWTFFGGTSAAAPQTAGLTALVNAARASQGKHLDPLLYKVRAVSAVGGEEPGSRPARVLAPAALAPRPSGSCSGRRARLDGRTVYTRRVA